SVESNRGSALYGTESFDYRMMFAAGWDIPPTQRQACRGPSRHDVSVLLNEARILQLFTFQFLISRFTISVSSKMSLYEKRANHCRRLNSSCWWRRAGDRICSGEMVARLQGSRD